VFAIGSILTISMFVLLATYVWSLIWSYRDAKRRGKSALLVTLLVGLASPFGFLAWLIFRPSQPIAPPDPAHEGRWKWILGLGIAGVVGIFAGTGAGLLGLPGRFKETAAYIEAMDRLRSSPAAIDVLGQPIEDRYWISGSLNVKGSGSGEEDLSIPVNGPRGKGTLYLKAHRSAGVWRLESLILDASGKRIDLLKSSSM
jgi:cytochrome oxidase complex assembly protein 1